MKISLDWLAEFVEIKYKPKNFAQLITEHCFEVEKILAAGAKEYSFSNVRVAKVLHFEKHPNADRLRIVKLDLSGQVIEPVVCGASNFASGDFVALALPGAIIPQNIHSQQHESFVLGKATIRGVESQGMICSAFELGLAEQPEEKPEILILPKNAKNGEDLKDFLNSKEKGSQAVFDLALPANRPDLFSHAGIARELAALLGLARKPTLARTEQSFDAKGVPKTLRAEIKNKNACAYYKAARFKVKIKPAPEFIQERLQALGLRPINNVVDITNYVMYALGEPLHAFDSAHVQGGIVVRNAHPEEKITTIDHKQRILDATMLVIADEKKALAVAGIMGGKQSEISAATKEIILEAANFEPGQIRRTSKKLTLRTDGSGFWEKGLHPKQAEFGFFMAERLLREYADAEILEMNTIGRLAETKDKIAFTADQVNSLLGSDFSVAQIKKHLRQSAIKFSGSKIITAEVPWYRKDMINAADIADELLKIIGFNEFEKKPLLIRRAQAYVNSDQAFNGLKEELGSRAFNEVQTYSFISPKDIKNFGNQFENHVAIKNPLSAEQAYLRKNLLISLIKTAALNAKNFDAFKLFELGKGYSGFMKEQDLLGAVICDKNQSASALYASAKGALEAVLQKYTDHAIKYIHSSNENTVDFVLLGKTVGKLGLVSRQILKNYDLDHDLAYFEIEIAPLLQMQRTKIFAAYSKYPQKVLDVSLLVAEDIAWQKISDVASKTGGTLLQKIELFEAAHLYPKNKLPRYHKELAEKGLKNLAFHLVFQAQDRTLKDSEILPIYDRIKVELKDKFNAEIR